MALDKDSRIDEPITLVLLYCGLRTGHFGVGTHVGSLIPFLRRQPSIKMVIIKTDVTQPMEVSFTHEDGIEILAIPQPENKLALTTDDDIAQKVYAQCIIDIMYPFLHKRPNLVFWVNSIDYLNVSYLIKEAFEGCKLIYVHHAWSWKHHINVPDEIFGRRWKASERHFHPLAFERNGYQQALAKIADHVITVTDQARNFFIDVLAIEHTKITKIYNGITTPEIDKLDKKALRRKYGFTSEEKIILFTGRIKREKGLHFLVKAFKKLADYRDDVKLVMVGNGDFKEFIPLASPHWSKVVFTGELLSEQVNELYAIADVGVLPSLFEQCSFTSIEMRFSYLPIIVSGVDGLDEMFEDGVDALKLRVYLDANGEKVFDEDEIAEKIRYLLSSPGTVQGLVNRSYEKALKLFTIATMNQRYLEVINLLVKSRSPSSFVAT